MAKIPFEARGWDYFYTCINKFYNDVLEVLELLHPPKLPEIEWSSPKTIVTQIKNVAEQKEKAKDYKAPIDTMVEKMAGVIAEGIRYQSYLASSENSINKENLDYFNEMIELLKVMVTNTVLGKKLMSLEDVNCRDNLEKLRNSAVTSIKA